MAITVEQALRREPRTAAQLQQLTGLSQPSISRRLAGLGAALLRSGKGKSTRYYLHRPLPPLSASMPIFQVSAQGQAQRFATLSPVYPHGYLIDHHGAQYYCEGLPWWLVDLRPQGFIGRNFALRHGLPANPDEWSDDEALTALLRFPHDTLGDLLAGQPAYDQWLNREPLIVSDSALEAMAEAALQGEMVGSSAGGEQPKFACNLNGQEVLAKFTARLTSDNARRWANLLRAEHLALQLLRAAGFASCHSRLIETPERLFLAISRYDRVAGLGRVGQVSLRTLDAEFIGKAPQDWPTLVAELAAQRLVAPQVVAEVSLLWCFGRLIANNDMHHGNLSFTHNGAPPFALAPCYDMLPMAFAPSRSGHMANHHQIQLHSTIAGDHWRRALPLAQSFWQQLAASDNVDGDFRAIAGQMAQQLVGIQPLIERMA